LEIVFKIFWFEICDISCYGMEAMRKDESMYDYLELLELSMYTKGKRKRMAGWESGPNERKRE
jgi:hypothetical protein